MATTTILQYLQNTGKSVTSGASVFLGTTPLDRLQTETFLTESAIVKGQVVSADLAKMATDATGGSSALTVITGVGNVATKKCVVGVAAESVTGTAANPQPVKVIVRGVVTGVATTGVTAVGQTIILDSAGGTGACQGQPTQVDEAGAAIVPLGPALGYALTVAAAGSCTVYIRGLFN